MRTIHRYTLTLVAVSGLALATSAAAQDRASGLLNTLAVQELVARAEPGDHLRLGAHFAALSDRYAAEAKRHTSMAHSFVGNPSRNLGTGMSAHCRQLAKLNAESASTARELAAYHETLASGAAATRPSGATSFEAGARAPQPTERELSALAAKASTRAEHLALEEYFRTLSKRYATAANAHAAFAHSYHGMRIEQAGAIHERLARQARDAAKEAAAAAEMHRSLAAIGR